MSKKNNNEFIIITGMSGAGRTEALHVIEDMGYFCVDNLPANMISNFLDLNIEVVDGQNILSHKLAVVCDARNGKYLDLLLDEIEVIKEKGISYKLIFLDADDEKLIARYKSSRRRHPLCADGGLIVDGVNKERDLLHSLKMSATNSFDTTNMLPQQLRRDITSIFNQDNPHKGLSVTVYSFGFKHKGASDADIVIDVRFLPNPYYNPALRNLTGLDNEVYEFVMYRKETIEFLKHWYNLLDCVMPGYVAEGKQQLAIAIGCTGGQHRSVAITQATGEYLKKKNYSISVAHRDLALSKSLKS